MAHANKLENKFQAQLIRDINSKFQGSIVLKLDAQYQQGIPDILVLYKDKWATLECKRHEKAIRQPNQEYYVNQMNKMSFSRFVYPENKEEVLHELQQTFNA